MKSKFRLIERNDYIDTWDFRLEATDKGETKVLKFGFLNGEAAKLLHKALSNKSKMEYSYEPVKKP